MSHALLMTRNEAVHQRWHWSARTDGRVGLLKTLQYIAQRIQKNGQASAKRGFGGHLLSVASWVVSRVMRA